MRAAKSEQQSHPIPPLSSEQTRPTHPPFLTSKKKYLKKYETKMHAVTAGVEEGGIVTLRDEVGARVATTVGNMMSAQSPKVSRSSSGVSNCTFVLVKQVN